MAEGRSNAAIANALVVSEGAVEKHVANIFSKLDLPVSENDHRRVLAVLRFLVVAGAAEPFADGGRRVTQMPRNGRHGRLHCHAQTVARPLQPRLNGRPAAADRVMSGIGACTRAHRRVEKEGDEGDPWGIREPACSIGLVLGAGGVVGQAYQAGVLSALQRETGWDPRRPPHRRAPPPARSPARHCGSGSRPPTWRRPSTASHVAPGRGHPAPHPSRRRRAAADPFPRFAVPPLEPALRRPDRPGGPPAPRLPARGGGHDTAPARPDRHLRAGPRAGRAHGDPLARGTAHLRRPAIGRCPGRLRSPRRAPGSPGLRRARLLRHPRVLPAGHHRGDRVRRRGRALGHQRRRPAGRGAGPRPRHLVHVGRPGRANGADGGSGAPCTGAWSARSHGWRTPGPW